RGANLWRSTRSLVPWLAAPVTAMVVLAFLVHGGWQGAAMRKKAHDYWRKNVLTYRGVALPSIARLDLGLAIDPPRRSLTSAGTYTLINRTTETLRAIPLTGGLEWKNV